MTVSPERTPVVVADLDEAIDAVRRGGLRLTAARRLVLEALLAARGPISAEEIADGLGGRMTKSDIASVYRNLETLGGLGLVRHFHAGHGPGRYVLESRADREYLACESCGVVDSVDPDALDGVRGRVRELTGFEARFSHFPIVGLCPRCARERKPGPTTTIDEGAQMSEEHTHDVPHAHEHEHDGETHVHAHTEHDHEHVEHEHEHEHDGEAHAHPHVHEAGVEDAHEHEHS